MSVEALTVALKTPIPETGRKFVLVVLANYADETGSCYPSASAIGEATGMANRTVYRHIEALEKDGYLTRERLRYDDGRLGVHRYFLQLPNWPVAKLASCQKRPNQLPNWQDNILKLDTKTNSSNKRAREKAPKAKPADILATVLSQAQATAVVEHRRAIKAPLTQRAAELLATNLSQWPNPDEAADEMIQRGWRGFKAEWMERDQHGTYARSQRNPVNGEFRSSVSDEKARQVAASWTPEELERRKAALKAEREQW